jgi:hypothetical protein
MYHSQVKVQKSWGYRYLKGEKLEANMRAIWEEFISETKIKEQLHEYDSQVSLSLSPALSIVAV